MMKTSTYGLIALLFCFSVSCGTSDSSEETGITQPKMTIAEMETPATLAVNISGMMCPDGCANVIQDEILAIDGISTSVVSFASKTGEFQYDAAIISQDEIIAAIEKVNKGAYKTETPVSSENDDIPSPETEAVEEITAEDEASV